MKFYNVASWTEASETRSRWGKQTKERKKKRRERKQTTGSPHPQRTGCMCLNTWNSHFHGFFVVPAPNLRSQILAPKKDKANRDHGDNTNRIQAGQVSPTTYPAFLFLTLGVVPPPGFMPWSCGSSLMMVRGGGNFKRWCLVGGLRLLVVLPSERVK